MLACLSLPSPADLSILSNEEFAACWRALIGEPPAILLQDRAEMVRLLMESLPPVLCPPEGRKPVRPAPEAQKAPAAPAAA